MAEPHAPPALPTVRCPRGHRWRRPDPGTDLRDGVLFCPECGLAMRTDADAPAAGPSTAPPPDSHAQDAAPGPLVASAASAASAADGEGRRFGRFLVVRPHARGGLGQVSVARDEELGRDVALKQIRPEFAHSPDSRQRFLNEARITGRLEHPNIVPVYALGRDDRGQPYYAMRLVEGRTLHEAIRAHHADRAGKSESPTAMHDLLTRFVSLCQAVAYAHAKGVVHRDLKPANVMLGQYGETMLLDWGVAKVIGETHSKTDAATALAPVTNDRAASAARSGPNVSSDLDAGAEPLADARSEGVEPGHTPVGFGRSAEDRGTLAPLTQQNQLLGTRAYLAPEQAQDAASVGPAADVYGLGAILSEILTGRPPGDEGPTSTVVPRRHRPLAAVAAKAMANRPSDRYPSATALADEVTRWLADEPVQAYHEPLFPTRAARWARKRKSVVAAATAALLVTTATLAFSNAVVTRERNATASALRNERVARAAAEDAERRARDEQARAVDEQRRALAQQRRADETAEDLRAVNAFFTDDVLGQASTVVQSYAGGAPSLDPNLKVRDALDRAGDRIGRNFADRPLVEASIREGLARSYMMLPDRPTKQTAEEHLLAALQLRVRHQGENDPRTFETRILLAECRMRADFSRGERYMLETLADARRVFNNAGEVVESCLWTLGFIYTNETALQWDKSLRAYIELVELRRARLGDDAPATIAATGRLAEAYLRTRRPDVALPLLTRVGEARQKLYGVDDERTLAAMQLRAEALITLGQLDEGERVALTLVEARRRMGNLRHKNHINLLQALAAIAEQRRDYKRAAALREEALGLRRELINSLHLNVPDDVQAGHELARLYEAGGDVENGRRMHNRVVDAATTIFAAGAAESESSGDGLKYWPAILPLIEDSATRTGRPEAFVQVEADILAILRREAELLTARIDRLPADEPARRALVRVRGSAHQYLGRLSEALADFRQCIDQQPDDWRLMSQVAMLELYLGNRDAYLARCHEMIRRFAEMPDGESGRRAAYLFLVAPDSFEAALGQRIEQLIHRGHRASLVPYTQLGLGFLAYRRGDFDRAVELLTSSRDAFAATLDDPETLRKDRVDRMVTANFFIAMAEHRRGRPAEATASFELARRQLRDIVPTPGHPTWRIGHPDWLVLQVVAREAEALLADGTSPPTPSPATLPATTPASQATVPRR